MCHFGIWETTPLEFCLRESVFVRLSSVFGCACDVGLTAFHVFHLIHVDPIYGIGGFQPPEILVWSRIYGTFGETYGYQADLSGKGLSSILPPQISLALEDTGGPIYHPHKMLGIVRAAFNCKTALSTSFHRTC